MAALLPELHLFSAEDSIDIVFSTSGNSSFHSNCSAGSDLSFTPFLLTTSLPLDIPTFAPCSFM